MSAAALLCAIIAQGGKVTSDFYHGDRGFAALVRHGFLREAGVLTSVVCDQCDAPHSAQVVYEGGKTGYFCPELGFTPLPPELSTAFLPDMALLVGRLADTFECRQRKTSILYGLTWRIGAARVASTQVMLYFHPTVKSEDDAHDLQNALSREVRSDWRLVVTSQGTFPVGGCTSVQLDDLIEIDTQTGALHTIADFGTLAGVPRKNTGGRPSEHGPMISRIIEERIANGMALEGRNKEAEAVLKLFVQHSPKEKAPSISSVRDYVTKARTRQ